MECGECGQEVEPNEYHTYEDCLHYLKEKGASPAEFRCSALAPSEASTS